MRGFRRTYIGLADYHDTPGMRGNRLGVLDKYAHVLSEYNERELKGLVEVAMSATQPSSGSVPELLRGSTADPSKDWITVGFPWLAQESGRWFFEVHLHEDCAAPQVGLLSSNFQARVGAKSSQGRLESLWSEGSRCYKTVT